MAIKEDLRKEFAAPFTKVGGFNSVIVSSILLWVASARDALQSYGWREGTKIIGSARKKQNQGCGEIGQAELLKVME